MDRAIILFHHTACSLVNGTGRHAAQIQIIYNMIDSKVLRNTCTS